MISYDDNNNLEKIKIKKEIEKLLTKIFKVGVNNRKYRKENKIKENQTRNKKFMKEFEEYLKRKIIK